MLWSLRLVGLEDSRRIIYSKDEHSGDMMFFVGLLLRVAPSRTDRFFGFIHLGTSLTNRPTVDMKLVRLPSRGIKDVSVNSDDQVITAGKQLTLHDPPSIDSIDLPVKQVLVNKPVDLAKFAKLDVHKEQICYTAENEVFLLPSFGKEPQLLIKDQGTVRKDRKSVV